MIFFSRILLLSFNSEEIFSKKKQDRKTECIESCAKIGVKFGGWGEEGVRKKGE
jgi:hypothetical protein